MQNVAQNLFNLLTSKDYTIKTLDSSGKEETDMEEVEMFSFDFEVNGKNFGTVVILLNSDGDMELFFGDTIGKAMNSKEKKVWTDLLYQLRMFSKRNMMGFKLENINRLKYSMQSMSAMNESFENIFEGYYGTSKTSYNPQGNAKIIIKHSKPIGEEDKRYRNISSIFIENEGGERFKLPFTKLPGARAMARHVTEGGNPYDMFGLHISEMVSDINTLGGFVRRSKMFEEDDATSALVETGRNHYANTRKGLKQIAGKRGYHTYKESWTPSELTETEEDIDSIRRLFTREAINAKVNDALPLLAKLSSLAEDEQINEILPALAGAAARGIGAKVAKSVLNTDDDDDESILSKVTNPLNMSEVNDEFIDITAMQQQTLREMLEERPVLYEDKIEYDKIQSIINQFTSEEPIIGNSYVYSQILMLVVSDVLIATESHFSQPYKLVGIDSSKFIFDINGEQKSLPLHSSMTDSGLKQVYLFNEIEDFEKLRSILSLTMKHNIKSKQIDEGKMSEVNEFENWADSIVDGSTAIAEGSWELPSSQDAIDDLVDFFSIEQPAGVDALNVTDALYDVINDDELFDKLGEFANEDPEGDSRPIVAQWISANLPDLAHKLDLHGEYDNPSADDFPREGLGEEKDLDSDKECSANNADSKITNKGNGMDKFKSYVREEKETDSKAVTEGTKKQNIRTEVEEDFKSLIQRTNYLLQK